MSEIIYTIQGRLRAPDQQWKTVGVLRPKTRDQADKLCIQLHRSMPMKDFRVQEINDEDIPF